MINAQQELIEFLTDLPEVKAMHVEFCPDYTPTSMQYNLKVGHSKTDFIDVLAAMNFEYNNGYGTQMLFGNIWFVDGSWAKRYEYDGSESWDDMVPPNIPSICL